MKIFDLRSTAKAFEPLDLGSKMGRGKWGMNVAWGVHLLEPFVCATGDNCDFLEECDYLQLLADCCKHPLSLPQGVCLIILPMHRLTCDKRRLTAPSCRTVCTCQMLIYMHFFITWTHACHNHTKLYSLNTLLHFEVSFRNKIPWNLTG